MSWSLNSFVRRVGYPTTKAQKRSRVGRFRWHLLTAREIRLHVRGHRRSKVLRTEIAASTAISVMLSTSRESGEVPADESPTRHFAACQSSLDAVRGRPGGFAASFAHPGTRRLPLRHNLRGMEFPVVHRAVRLRYGVSGLICPAI